MMMIMKICSSFNDKRSSFPHSLLFYLLATTVCMLLLPSRGFDRTEQDESSFTSSWFPSSFSSAVIVAYANDTVAPIPPSFFPVASTEVSQWTADALFVRFFLSGYQDLVYSAALQTFDAWQSSFNVYMYEECTKANFATVVEKEGSTTHPTIELAVQQQPWVTLLPDNTLGLYVILTGNAWVIPNVWFIEGTCFGTSCQCTGFPTVDLCQDERVTLDFGIVARVRVSLVPDAGGLLPLPIVETVANISSSYHNLCTPSETPVPWYVEKFNHTYFTALDVAFHAALTDLNRTLVDTMNAFVEGTLWTANEAMFPAWMGYNEAALTSEYRLPSVFVNSTGDAITGAQDVNASVTYNVSGRYTSLTPNGTVLTYAPASPPPSLYIPTQLDDHALATRITFWSEYINVVAWQAASRSALNDNVNNTLLDATLVLNVDISIPTITFPVPFGPIPEVTELTKGSDIDREFFSGAMAPLMSHLQRGYCNVTCRNETLDLIYAFIHNLTARTELLIQLDDPNDVFVTPANQPTSYASPSFVPSLFIWIVDFNGFHGATFEIVRPTGGLPEGVLDSIIEKGLNESRPYVNKRFRQHRLPLPPAAALLLHPVQDTSQVPALSTVDPTYTTFASARPNAPIPPPPPPSLTNAIPVIVGLQANSDVHDHTHSLITQSASLLGPSCRQMLVYNGVTYHWQVTDGAIVNAGYIGNASQPNNVTVSSAFWPLTVSLLCTDSACKNCTQVNVPLQTNPHNGILTQSFYSPIHNSTSELNFLVLTATSPKKNDVRTLDARCLQEADLTLQRYGLLMGGSTMCGTMDVAEAQIVGFDFPPISPHGHEETITCAPIPDSSGQRLALLSGVQGGASPSIVGPCYSCPASVADVSSSCPGASSAPPPSGNQKGQCLFDGAVFVAPSAVFPRCSYLWEVFPPQTPAKFAVTVWVPVMVVCFLVACAIGTCIVARVRRQRKAARENALQKNRRKHRNDSKRRFGLTEADLETGNLPPRAASEHSTTFSVQDEGTSSRFNYGAVAAVAVTAEALLSNGNVRDSSTTAGDVVREALETLSDTNRYLRVRWTVHRVLYLMITAVTFIGALTFGLASPFSYLTASRAQKHGLPSVVHLARLHEELQSWNYSMVAVFGATGLFTAVLLACVEGRHRCTEGRSRVRSYLRQWSPLILTLIVIVTEFAVLVPPMQMDVLSLATVSLQLNATTSVVDPTTLEHYGNMATSIASLLLTLPVLLQLVGHSISVVAIAVGLGCFLYVYHTPMAPPSVADHKQDPWVTTLRRWCTEDLLEDRSPAAVVPTLWVKIATLCATCSLTVSLVTCFVTFQMTREIAPFVVGLLRTVVTSVCPFVTIYFLHRSTMECEIQATRNKKRSVQAQWFLRATIMVDVLATLIESCTSSVMPAATAFVFHVTILVVATVFFFVLVAHTARTLQEAILEEGFGNSSSDDEDFSNSRPARLRRGCKRILAHLPHPIWRLPCSLIATVFLLLSFDATLYDAEHPTLRNDLIQYMQEEGIQFPDNISRVHLVVDPGLDAYQDALKVDVVIFGAGAVISALSTVFLTLQICWPTVTLSVCTRATSVLAYLILVGAALYFTIPDFAEESDLDNVIPDCACEFFQQGELLVKTFARLFFSSVVFGRLLPLLVAFPPAMIRVFWLTGVSSSHGSSDHFSPMLVATIVTITSIQLPLTVSVMAADARMVMWVGLTLPLALLIELIVFHPTILAQFSSFTDPASTSSTITTSQTYYTSNGAAAEITTAGYPTQKVYTKSNSSLDSLRKQGRRLSPVLHTLLHWLWLIVYVGGWGILLVEAIAANERLWNVAKHMFQSPAFWYDLVATVFLATMAFYDCLSTFTGEADEELEIVQAVNKEEEGVTSRFFAQHFA